MTHDEEQRIARDLHLCDLVQAIGRPQDKARATRHRRAAYAALRRDTAQNHPEIAAMGEDDLLDALGVES